MSTSRRDTHAQLQRARWAGRISLAFHRAAQQTIESIASGRSAVDELQPIRTALTGLIIGLDSSVSNRSLEGQIIRLNKLVADTYGAAAARIGMAGSSGLNLTIQGLVVPKLMPPGRNRVLVDRDGHMSVLGGLAYSGLEANWIYRRYDNRHDVQCPVSPRELDEALNRHDGIGGVCITSPTYEGANAPVEELSEVCRRHGALLIVDGAWGPAYGVLSDAGFPASAISCGADIVIISLHKKGFAPAPISAALFSRNEYAELYDAAANLGFQTTSPNFVLLAITEHLLMELAQGNLTAEWARACHAAEEFRCHLHEAHPLCRAVRFSDIGAVSGDPGHVLVHVGAIGITGFDLQQALNERGIDPEKATRDTVLFLFGPREVGQVDLRIADLKSAIDHCLAHTRPEDAGTSRAALLMPQVRARAELSVRQAELAPSASVPLAESVGRIAAQVVAPYPPGTALLVPGERIHRDQIDYLRAIWANRGHVRGVSGEGSTATIRVIVE